MRLVKILGLVAVSAAAATAFVGTTPASATTTMLCVEHGGLTCNLPETTVSMVNEGSGRLLSDLVDVICDDIEVTGTPLASGAPQQIHVSELDFESCETNGGDGCVVTVIEQPLANLLKTGLDAGTLTGASGEILVECEDVFFSTDIHCLYDTAGVQFSVGAQHLTASETQLEKISGSLCPDESFLDGLLTIPQDKPPVVVGAVGEETALCKAHDKDKEKCEGGLITEVHLLAKSPVGAFGAKTVQCKESLLKGQVGALALPQVITVNELTFTECKLYENEKEIEGCKKVETTQTNTWKVAFWGPLNFGLVKPESWIKVECGTIDCVIMPMTWKAEGSTATHKGKIAVAWNTVVIKGGKTCPSPITWSASYESVTEKFYVLK